MISYVSQIEHRLSRIPEVRGAEKEEEVIWLEYWP